MFLLLGDYTIGCPWSNEVVHAIRGLTNACVIRGNHEDYFANTSQFDLNSEQFKAAQWVYNSLTKENHEYLAALPEAAVVAGNIHLSHKFNLMNHRPMATHFNPRDFRIMMESAPISHEEYLARARMAVLACPQALADIRSLPEGVCLFGHNHLQFHMENEGRLLINPGSCGNPLDFFDATAAYSILIEEGGCRTVIERRVTYDKNEVIQALAASEFATISPMWSRIFQLEQAAAKVYMTPFVMHLMETGRALGQTNFPVSDEVWHVAVKTWDEEKP